MAGTLGAQIRRLRKKRHMTMKQLADAIGYSLDYVWRIETDRARPSGKIIQVLADFFGAELLLDLPEDNESRVLAEQVLAALPPEVRAWLEASKLPSWLIFAARADQRGLTPEQLEQAVKLFQAAKEYLGSEKTDNPQ